MVTSLYVGILGLLYFKISMDTIVARGREKVSLGPGAQNEILHLVSAHGNFASYTPIFLMMFFLLEIQNVSPVLLYILGSAFILGRMLHYLTMKDKERVFKKRKLAMQLTLWPLIALSVINIYFYLAAVLKF